MSNNSVVIRGLSNFCTKLRLAQIANIIHTIINQGRVIWFMLGLVFLFISFFSTRQELFSIPALLLLAVVFFSWLTRNEKHAKVFTVIIIFALLIHTVIVFGAAMKFDSFADEDFYQHYSVRKANQWRGGESINFSEFLIERGNTGVFYFHALIKFFFGNALIVSRIASAVLIMGAALLISRMAKSLYDDKTAAVAFGAASLMPSFLFWGSFALKEPLALFFAALGLSGIFGILIKKKAFPGIIIVLGAATILVFIRFYFGGFLLISLAFALLRKWVGRRAFWIIITAGLIITMSTMLLAFVSDDSIKTDIKQGFELVDHHRRALAFGDTAFYRDIDISTVTGFARFLPIGISYALLAPFPWQINSLSKLALLPDTLLWYFFLMFIPFGLTRTKNDPAAIGLLVFTAACLLFFGMIDGNLGTLVRHRTIIMMLGLVFASGGLVRTLTQSVDKNRRPMLS